MYLSNKVVPFIKKMNCFLNLRMINYKSLIKNPVNAGFGHIVEEDSLMKKMKISFSRSLTIKKDGFYTDLV